MVERGFNFDELDGHGHADEIQKEGRYHHFEAAGVNDVTSFGMEDVLIEEITEGTSSRPVYLKASC